MPVDGTESFACHSHRLRTPTGDKLKAGFDFVELNGHHVAARSGWLYRT